MLAGLRLKFLSRKRRRLHAPFDVLVAAKVTLGLLLIGSTAAFVAKSTGLAGFPSTTKPAAALSLVAAVRSSLHVDAHNALTSTTTLKIFLVATSLAEHYLCGSRPLPSHTACGP